VKQLAFVRRAPLRASVGLAVVLTLGPPAAIFRSVVWAQGAAHDETGALTATAPEATGKTPLEKQFAGTSIELDTYVGSGTFYRRYSDPYVSNGIYLKPIYHLPTKRDLTLNARLYVEVEYTSPDNPEARRFYPLDPWLWLSAKNLYTEPRSRIRFGGQARLVLPVSYESRYQHLLAGVGLGANATRESEFGRPDAKGKRWGLTLSLGVVVVKNINSSVLRGNRPGDTTGCMNAPPATTQANAAEPGAASSDRCGGPLNTNVSLLSAGSVSITRGRWSAGAILYVINNFRYAAPADAFSSTNTPLGREDVSWGILTLGYEIRQHIALAVGISSQQPALDARYRYPRFPFFDFSGTNANNYTQAFVALGGTI
jgi:hypothetical protein